MWKLILCVFTLAVFGTTAGDLSFESEDVVDLDAPRIRIARDYGSNLGGPVAANGLPADIGPESGPPPTDAPVTNPCTPSTGDCTYDMRAQQRPTNTQSKSLGYGVCNSVSECQQECEKRGCNYITLGGMIGSYSAHYMQLDPPPARGTPGVMQSAVFDSLVKICGAERKRLTRNRRDSNGPHAPLQQRPVHDTAHNAKDILDPDHDNRDHDRDHDRDWDRTPPTPSPNTRQWRTRSNAMSTRSGPMTTGRPDGRNNTHRHESSRNSTTRHNSTTSTRSNSTTNSNSTNFCNTTETNSSSTNRTASNSTTTTSHTRCNSTREQATTSYYSNHYNKHYQKKYSEAERAQRIKNFNENVNFMSELNRKRKGPDDAACGLNAFSDEDRKTFTTRFGGATVDSNKDVGETVQNKQPDSSSGNTKGDGGGGKSKFDWRQLNVIPPIRYQGSCGACYAFASADVIAAQNAIERQKPKKTASTANAGESVLPLSPQYLIDCSPPGAALGCNGGRPINVVQGVAQDMLSGGVPLEACYRYQGNQSATCNNNVACCQRSKIQKAKMLDVSGPSEKQLMSSLLNNGPVLVIININEVWQFYNGSGVIKSHQCDPTQRIHAVSIVGHDFTGPTPYYWVKNSWSTSWGIEGYAKLEAGTNACGVAKNVITTCVRNCETTMKDTASVLRRNHAPQ